MRPTRSLAEEAVMFRGILRGPGYHRGVEDGRSGHVDRDNDSPDYKSGAEAGAREKEYRDNSWRGPLGQTSSSSSSSSPPTLFGKLVDSVGTGVAAIIGIFIIGWLIFAVVGCLVIGIAFLISKGGS